MVVRRAFPILMAAVAFAWVMPCMGADARPDDRIPEPKEELQTQSLRNIRGVYRDEYAKRTDDDRRLLAGKLYEEGRKSQAEPANQYVLLREAKDLAIIAGDVDLAVLASKALGDHFALDGFEMTNKTLATIRPILKTPDKFMLGYAAAVQNAVLACEKEQFEAAARSADLAVLFATGAKNLQKAGEATGLKTAVAAQSKAFDEYKLGLETIKKVKGAAALADANQAVGLYTAVYLKQWTDGLKMIAKGSSATWAPAADADLKNPSKSDEMMIAGDLWWGLSNAEAGHRYRLQERAEYWYNLALPGAEGVNKAKIEKRLEAIAQGKPSYLGGAEVATKQVLPTTLELTKLKDVCRLYQNGDATKRAEIQKMFAMLEARLQAELMNTKPADFAIRLKADLDLRKLLEDNGAGDLAKLEQPLYNKMSDYTVAAKSKDDLADRIMALEKLHGEMTFMPKANFDGTLYAALRAYVANNQVTYSTNAAKSALADSLKAKGVKSSAVERFRTTMANQQPTLGTPKPKP